MRGLRERLRKRAPLPTNVLWLPRFHFFAVSSTPKNNDRPVLNALNSSMIAQTLVPIAAAFSAAMRCMKETES